MAKADPGRHKPLGQVLKEMELVSEGQIQESLQIQRKQGGVIGEILVNMGYVAREEILLALHRSPAGQSALASAAGITRFEPLTPRDLAHLNEWRLALKGLSTP